MERSWVNIVERETINRKDINNYNGDLYGKLECELIVRTPMAIPDTCNGDGKIDEHKRYPFMRLNQNELVIPGSALRGSIRSIYEAATKSCASTFNTDKQGMIVPSTRTSFKDRFVHPGILKKENGKWVLYKADRYLLPIKGKEYSFFGGCKNYGIVRGNKVKFSGVELEYGDFIKNCNLIMENGRPKIHTKDGFLVYSGIIESLEKSDIETDYSICIGGAFSKKHGEYVFHRRYERVDMRNIVNADQMYDELLKVHSIYNSDNNKTNNKYKDFGNAIKNMSIPIWYSITNGQIHVSLASVGRKVYDPGRTLKMVVGEKAPCSNRKQVCKACALFGMVSADNSNNIGSKVRVSDAVCRERSRCQYITLKELYSPTYHYSNDGKCIGRKFYKHISPNTRNSFETDNNSTLEFVDRGTRFVFDVYFDGISEKQLQELEWALTFWDNCENSGKLHSIGHGKSLGFGSVKIIISRENKRRYSNDEGYSIDVNRHIEMNVNNDPLTRENKKLLDIVQTR